MKPKQKVTVNALKADGFTVVEVCRDIVRLSKGADSRLVREDGTQVRGQHKVVSGNRVVQPGRYAGHRIVAGK